jgi:exonuclease SbcD
LVPVKILHTSDWHLGRAFHGVGMLEHQAAFIDHLIETVESEAVDLVVVAGDVYDRGLPPVDAVQVADEAMRRLAASRARTVITSGNHDSARRLGFASGLIDAAGVHLRTDIEALATPVVVEDRHGPVAVYGIPYLDPDVARRRWQLTTRSHEAALGEALGRIRADLTRRTPTRSVVLAHAFVAGGQPSESERDITVGGVSRVPVGLFDGIDYTALGHLHGRQALTDSVRYSGSPLAYSFSEARHEKGSWLVELGPDGVEDADFVPAPLPRALRRLRGDLADLLADPTFDDAENAWVEVTLTDARRPPFPMEQLRRRFPHTLSLVFAPVGGDVQPARKPVRGRSDIDVTLDFVHHLRGVPATPEETAVLQSAVEACCGVD